MTDPNVPLMPDARYFFELPNGHFIKIDLNANCLLYTSDAADE